jgi:hypothetical protein
VRAPPGARMGAGGLPGWTHVYLAARHFAALVGRGWLPGKRGASPGKVCGMVCGYGQ